LINPLIDRESGDLGCVAGCHSMSDNLAISQMIYKPPFFFAPPAGFLELFFRAGPFMPFATIPAFF
jgi:hypothetical protein